MQTRLNTYQPFFGLQTQGDSQEYTITIQSGRLADQLQPINQAMEALEDFRGKKSLKICPLGEGTVVITLYTGQKAVKAKQGVDANKAKRPFYFPPNNSPINLIALVAGVAKQRPLQPYEQNLKNGAFVFL